MWELSAAVPQRPRGFNRRVTSFKYGLAVGISPSVLTTYWMHNLLMTAGLSPTYPIYMIYVQLMYTSSSIQLSATGRLLEITYMCYEFRTPLFPAQLLQARQSDLSVTSIPQSVNRWRHNEYSCCSHPLLFVPASHTPVVKVRLVVWRSDLTGQGGCTWLGVLNDFRNVTSLVRVLPFRPSM